jgi:hypothetical protein
MSFGDLQQLEYRVKLYHEVEELFPQFFGHLAERHPNLSQQEVTLSALLLLQCKNMEIAERMGGEVRTIEESKHRLKKKFALDRELSLSSYLLKVAGKKREREKKSNSALWE